MQGEQVQSLVWDPTHHVVWQKKIFFKEKEIIFLVPNFF